eukprot:3848409-Pleurochrysis_carterae.AAC.5
MHATRPSIHCLEVTREVRAEDNERPLERTMAQADDQCNLRNARNALKGAFIRRYPTVQQPASQVIQLRQYPTNAERSTVAYSCGQHTPPRTKSLDMSLDTPALFRLRPLTRFYIKTDNCQFLAPASLSRNALLRVRRHTRRKAAAQSESPAANSPTKRLDPQAKSWSKPAF